MSVNVVKIHAPPFSANIFMYKNMHYARSNLCMFSSEEVITQRIIINSILNFFPRPLQVIKLGWLGTVHG